MRGHCAMNVLFSQEVVLPSCVMYRFSSSLFKETTLLLLFLVSAAFLCYITRERVA